MLQSLDNLWAMSSWIRPVRGLGFPGFFPISEVTNANYTATMSLGRIDRFEIVKFDRELDSR
jgi:hypothetical protein